MHASCPSNKLPERINATQAPPQRTVVTEDSVAVPKWPALDEIETADQNHDTECDGEHPKATFRSAPGITEFRLQD
jgi:hypothetical protein